MKRNSGPILDIKTALDNLAAVVGIHLDNAPSLVILDGKRILTDPEEISSDMSPWLSGEGPDPVLEVLDLSYKAVYDHLVQLYEKDEVNWKSKKSREGVASMMAMVGESAKKIEDFLVFRIGAALKEHVHQRPAFLILQDFYTHSFAPKFVEGVEGEEVWAEEWGKNKSASLLDATNTGLKDFETVRSDSEYELFYIRNEEGKSYFNKELLRNVKLSCDFDLNAEGFEEDPILQVRAMVDKDLHASASQILEECHAPIADFFKIVRKLEDNELAKSLSMAISALLLSTNSKNLIQNAAPKSALQYFNDFHYFLRRAMKTNEYQKLLAYPPEGDKNAKLLIDLTHALCKSIFTRVGGVKQESMGLIHRTMRKGEEIKQKKAARLLKGDTIWNQFLLDDEKLRTLLAQFPNGPLFKVLDLIREESDEDAIIPFDPLGQDNIPARIYELKSQGEHIDVLRIPSPTRQSFIHKADVVDEFRGFLRALSSSASKKKHLLINLQDRTSWKEYARSRLLEQLQMNAEFSSQFFVITLPKDTEFYHQANEYEKLDDAQDFLKVFFEQLKNPEDCGYFFPAQIKNAEWMQFIKEVLPLIHQHFFGGRKKLTRRNREDFIEIFYQFLILKCVEILKPTSISFTCKDAIDTGAAATAGFYGFVKLIQEDFTKKEEQDFLRWLLYTPALFIRERAILPERLNRTLSVLEQMDLTMAQEGKEVLKAFGDLYAKGLLQKVTVRHL